MQQDRLDAAIDALAGPDWLRAVREKAAARHRELGPPTGDRWKFGKARDLMPEDLAPTAGAGAALDDLEPFRTDGETARVVLVDGRFDASLSQLEGLPPGVLLGPLADHLDDAAVRSRLEATADDDQSFTLLNTALVRDGALLRVPADARVEGHVHLLHVQTGRTTRAVRHVIEMGARAEATVVESYVHLADEAGHTNAVTEVQAADGARLVHVRIEKEDRTATHVGRVLLDIHRDATVRSFHLAIGSHRQRTEIEADLLGEGATADLQGVFFGAGDQCTDTWTRVEHRVPNGTSHERFKGILDDESRGSFTGSIVVHPGAQKTSSNQENRNLLLSRKAHVDTTPQLEIHADDVKCAHGSTIGQLDDKAVFFLRSRGIDKQKARMMLTRAFAAEVIRDVPDEAIRVLLDRYLHVWFVKHHEHLRTGAGA